MYTIFRHRLVRFRGQILGWGIGLALLGLLLVQMYDTFAGQQEQLNQLLESYPEEFIAFFGDFNEFATPEGFLGIEFFSYMPLILGIFAVLMGSGLLVSDEENGRLDLLMAFPISRTALFMGRVLAFVMAAVVIMFIAWLGLTLPTYWTPMDVGIGKLALPFLSLLAVLLFFGMLALLLSMVLPSRRASASVAGLVLVASYFISSLARINTDLEPFADLSPITYYQGGDAINGLNWMWFVGLLLLAFVFAVLAWWGFQRRDIRVGGEGGWQLPSWSSFKRLLSGRPPSSSETATVQR